MNKIAVIDYGMGNLRSVAKALECVAGEAQIQVTADAGQVRAADRVVLPGVGALGDCMAELQRRGLDDVVREVVASKPLLGICLGMQALLDESEENGGTRGLGIIPGHVRRFADDMVDETSGERLKVPHMGWNQVHQLNAQHPMWRDIDQESRFYFVHGYYVAPEQGDHRAATTHYGVEFSSVVAAKNIFAVQFHPEKSQQAGLTLLRNFVEWDGRD